jgi:hypothetical protein
MFTHRDADVQYDFKTLHCQSGHALTLTSGHYLYINGALAPAETARVGDMVALGNGAASAILDIADTSSTGLYNPQTLHGDIVVDGVLASTYTTAIAPTVAHAWLLPLRLWHQLFGRGTVSFDHGADRFAELLPSGPLSC